MGYFYSILSMLLMAFVPTLNKFAIQGNETSYIAFMISAFASIMCFLYVMIFQRSIPENYKKILQLGLINGLALLFFFKGLELLSPATVSLLNRLYIVFSIFLGLFIFKEKASMIDAMKIILTLTGMFLFVFKEMVLSDFIGIVSVVFSALLFSITNSLIKTAGRKASNVQINLIVNISSTIFLFVAYLLSTESAISFTLETKTLYYVLASALFGPFLGLIFLYQSFSHLPFYKANLIRSVSPLLTFSISYYFFPVELSNINKLGVLLIMVGIIGVPLFNYIITSNAFNWLIVFKRFATRPLRKEV